MFKLLQSFYENFIFTKPSVSYIQPRSLNVYFKNSIEPKFQVINLTNYDSFSLEMETIKENEENIFIVNLITYKNEIEAVIELARFETKTEALDAISFVKNKLFSPLKGSVKLIYIATILVFLFTFLLAVAEVFVLNKNVRPMTQQQYLQQQGLNINPQVNPQQQMMSQEEQRKIFEQLQASRVQAFDGINEAEKNFQMNRQQQVQQPQEIMEVPSAIQVPQDPEVKGFLNSLSK